MEYFTVDTTNSPDMYAGHQYRNIVISTTNIIVAFYEISEDEVYAKMSKDGGYTWTKLDGTAGSTQITTNLYSQWSVSIDTINNIYVAYGDTTTPKLLKLTYVPASGTWTVGSPVSVDAGLTTGIETCVVKDPFSTLWYIVNYYSGGHMYVKVYSSTNDGVAWSGATTIADVVCGTHYLKSVITLVGNRPWIFYTDTTDDYDYGDIYVTKYNGVSWSVAENISGSYSDFHVAKVGTNKLLLSCSYYLYFWDGAAWIDLFSSGFPYWYPGDYYLAQELSYIHIAVSDDEGTAWIIYSHPYQGYQCGTWYQKLDLVDLIFDKPSYFFAQDNYYIPSVPETIPAAFLESGYGCVPVLISVNGETDLGCYAIERQRNIQAKARITDGKVTVVQRSADVYINSDYVNGQLTSNLFKTSDGKLLLLSFTGSVAHTLRYSVSDDNGATWEAPINIATDLANYASNDYSGFLDADNNLYVVYAKANTSVYFRKLTYGGGSWSVGAEVCPNSSYADYNPIIWKNPVSGKLWLFVATYTDTDWWIIRYTSSTDDGVNWAGDYTTTGLQRDDFMMDIITAFGDSNDKMCVIGRLSNDGNQLVLRKSTANVAAWSGDYYINDFGGSGGPLGMPYIDRVNGRAYMTQAEAYNDDYNGGIRGDRWNKFGAEYTYGRWKDVMQTYIIDETVAYDDLGDETLIGDPVLINGELWIVTHYMETPYARKDKITKETRNNNNDARDPRYGYGYEIEIPTHITSYITKGYEDYHFPQQNLGTSVVNIPFVFYDSIGLYASTYSFYEYNENFKEVTAKGNIKRVETNTMTAKARIFPPISVQTAITANIRKFKAKLEIQWDGINWTNESSRFLSANIDTQLESNLGQSLAGQMDVEVENTDYRFTAGATSPIDAYLHPKIPIRLSMDFEDIGYYIRLFTGYIKAYQPNTLTGICNLHCFDNTQLILNKPANRDIYTDIYTSGAIENLLLDAGLTIDQFNLEEGTQTIPVVWTEDKYVNSLINDLSVAERGRAFFDEYGIFRFWNKDHLHNLPALLGITLTKNDWVLAADYEIAENGIKNSIIVQAKPRANSGLQVVWSNGDIEALDPFSDTLVYIPASGYQNAWIETEDPCTGWVRPVPNSDYIANTAIDGTGTDITSYIDIVTFDTYDASAFIKVVNRYPGPCYFTRFNVRADPLPIYKWIQAKYTDQASIDLYDEQKLTIENDFIADETTAKAIAQEELRRLKDNKNNFRVKIIGIPYVRCGDIVTLEMANGTYDDYMIYDLNTILDENGLVQQLILVEPIYLPGEYTIEANADIKKNETTTIQAKANIYILT